VAREGGIPPGAESPSGLSSEWPRSSGVFARSASWTRQSGIWTQADSLIGELASVGSQVNTEIMSGRPDPVRLESLLNDVDKLSGELTQLEDAFSRTMGDGARWAARVVFVAIVRRRRPAGGARRLRILAYAPAGAGVGGVSARQRGPAPAGAEDGGGGSAYGRHCARLQQSAHRDPLNRRADRGRVAAACDGGAN
jgi:hypothetical protein